MRRLPRSAVCRLGERDLLWRSLRIVSGPAENTHSIFCDGSSESETANGCLVLPSAGTDAKSHTFCAWNILGLLTLHALPSVPGTPGPLRLWPV
jgi:hypothetical protein